MNVHDIFNRILVKSGQFLLRTDNIELDQERFKVLVEDVLAIYNKYRPMDGHVFIDMGSPRTQAFNEFTVSEEGYKGIPDEVIDVVPVRPTAINMYYLQGMGFGNRAGGEYLQEKTQVPFKYHKPKITTAFSGKMDVHAWYYHRIEQSQDSGGTITYDIPHMTYEEAYFFELLKGQFLQSLGRSRRAFTITDIPITMDSDQIVSEGMEIYDKAFEQLVDNASKFYLAYGG